MMKLAILSDIHGNWPALEAVMADVGGWRPDAVVVNGDVINDGPSNSACWAAVAGRRARDGWVVLRGNHEEYVAEWLNPATPRAGPAYDLIRLSQWTYQQMKGDVADLTTLPEQWLWHAPDGSRLVAMHGTLLGNRAGIYPFTSDDEVRRRRPGGAAVFVTAHTHVPHSRRLDGTQIVNVGSVGIPGDGDGRAAYGRFTWTCRRGWQTEIVRVAYDRAAAERDDIGGGEHLSVLYFWHEAYGADLVSLGLDTLECLVERPPDDARGAFELAVQHYAYCPALMDNLAPAMGALAATLFGRHWFFDWH